MNIHELLDNIPITPKLVYYINSMYRKMIGQIRFSLGKLNGITSVEINRLFALTNIEPEDLEGIMNQYPKDVFVMRQPIYNLLTLIVMKSHLIGNTRLAIDTNLLLGMVFLGRLKYKYIRVVDQNLMEKTIQNLSKKSYIGLHGVLWMIAKLCKDTHDAWMDKILSNLDDMYPRYRYIIDFRNKFNQVMKTVARAYYYNFEHRNDIDRSVIIKARTNEILNYLLEKSIPSEIFELAANICQSSPDKINNLHYNIQTYNSMQAQATLLIYNILDRLFAYLNTYKQQFNKNCDINDPLFLRSFYVAMKRSTIMLKTASDPIFTSYGYTREEVLAYGMIVTLFIDSTNHNSEYYGNTQSGSYQDDFNKNYNSFYDSDYQQDNYTVNMESIDIYEDLMNMAQDGVFEDYESFQFDKF